MPTTQNIQGAGFTAPSASDSYSGQLSTPKNYYYSPIDTSSVMTSTPEVSSVGNMLPSLMNFGGGLLGAGLSFLSNNAMFKKQVAEQKRREQFQLQWRNEEREYNSPAAQIARLNDAGLNGKLLLAQQGLTQGQTAPQTGAVSPGMDASGPASILSQSSATAANLMMQQKLMQAQIDNIDAQTSKTQAETMLLPEQLKGLSLSNETYSATQSAIIRKTKLEAVQQYLQNIITSSEADIQRQQARIIQTYGMSNADKNSKILEEEYNRLLQEIVILQKQGKNIDADTLVKKSSARLNSVLSGYYSAQTNYTNSQIKLTNAQTDFTRREAGTIPRFSGSDLYSLADSLVKHAAAEAGISELQQKLLDNTFHNTPGSPYPYTSFGAALNGWLGSLGQVLGGAAIYSISGRSGARPVKGFAP